MAITFAQMTNIEHAARTHFYKGYVETQKMRSHTIRRRIKATAVGVSPGYKFEWKLRTKSADGSAGASSFYEEFQGQRDTYDTNFSATPCQFKSHTNLLFDLDELSLLENNPDKIYNEVDMRYSAAEESLAEFEEALYLNAPYSDVQEEGRTNMQGLLRIAGWSQSSAGAFVAQRTPKRNGVYVTLGDGTVTGTIFGADRTLIANQPFQTVVSTHEDAVDEQLLVQMRDTLRENGFMYLEELRGEKPKNSTWEWLCGSWFTRRYEDLLSKLGHEKRRDYFNAGPTSIAGAGIEEAPSLDTHAMRPLIAVDWSLLKLNKFNGMWKKIHRFQPSATTSQTHMKYFGQMWTKQPGVSIALIHGAF